MDLVAFAGHVAVAFGLGVIIGLERELRNHEAGLRTNALVALGAALFVSLPRLLALDGDSTRIAGQVVTGIGFLAGGVIIRDGFSIRGLNTAGTLWCTAAVGTLAGSGFPLAALIGTGVILVLHIALRPATNRLDDWVRTKGHLNADFRVKLVAPLARLSELRTAVLEIVPGIGIRIRALRSESCGRPEEVVLVADVTAPDERAIERLTTLMSERPGVSEAGWTRQTA